MIATKSWIMHRSHYVHVYGVQKSMSENGWPAVGWVLSLMKNNFVLEKNGRHEHSQVTRLNSPLTNFALAHSVILPSGSMASVIGGIAYTKLTYCSSMTTLARAASHQGLFQLPTQAPNREMAELFSGKVPWILLLLLFVYLFVWFRTNHYWWGKRANTAFQHQDEERKDSFSPFTLYLVGSYTARPILYQIPKTIYLIL